MNVKILTYKEALQYFPEIEEHFYTKYDNVAVFNDNVNVDNHDTFLGYLKEVLPKKIIGQKLLVVVKGDLLFDGRIQLIEGNEGCSLYVTGFTKAHTLEVSAPTIILNDSEFSCFVFGDYNDGSLYGENLKTPFLIISDHDTSFNSVSGTLVNAFSTYDDFFSYDIYEDQLDAYFVPEVLYQADEENLAFDFDVLHTILQAGDSPLKKKG